MRNEKWEIGAAERKKRMALRAFLTFYILLFTSYFPPRRLSPLNYDFREFPPVYAILKPENGQLGLAS